MSPIIPEKQSSLRNQTSVATTTTIDDKKRFPMLSKSINPTASPLLNEAVKEQIILYTKLFVIMGMSWIFEIIEPLLLDNENNDELDNCSARVISKEE